MSNQLADLKSMIEFASAQAEKIFRKTGALYPMYHAIKRNGDTVILTPDMGDKDIAVAMMTAWLVLNEIDRYVFIDEAWIVDGTASGVALDVEEGAARRRAQTIRTCREIVMFAAENLRGERMTGKRFILRPEIGKPKLSPLTFDDFDNSTGRMVGLLQCR